MAKKKAKQGVNVEDRHIFMAVLAIAGALAIAYAYMQGLELGLNSADAVLY